MKRQITLISGFVLLNMAIGWLFHESLNLVCFSELIAIAISSFVFWNIVAKQLKKRLRIESKSDSKSRFFKHGALGIAITFTNVLISQGIIVFLMVYVYNCTSPSFTFVNASLTNNAAINLVCYFALVYSVFEANKAEIEAVNKIQENDKDATNAQLVLSSGNKQHIVDFNDINFIEASNNCIVINSSKGQFVKYQSLKSFITEHNKSSFKRIHRSYVVNTNHIDFVEKNKNGDGIVTLKNRATIKLSRNYKLDCFN